MSSTIINIAKQYSRYPAGRLRGDGPFNGERFRDEHLVPVLQSGGHAVVEFDGARGYGSSFLEEAFGGLVRLGYTPEIIRQSFKFKSSDQSLIDEINDYIEHGA